MQPGVGRNQRKMVFRLQVFKGLSRGCAVWNVTRWGPCKVSCDPVGPLDQEEFPNGLCIDASGSLEEEKFSTLSGSAFSPVRAAALDGKQAWPSSSAGRRRRRGSCHLGCRPGPTLRLPPSSSLHSCSSGCSPLISLPHTGLPAFTLHHFSHSEAKGVF